MDPSVSHIVEIPGTYEQSETLITECQEC